MQRLKEKETKVIVYEPTLNSTVFLNSPVLDNLRLFKPHCDVIVTNRITEEIQVVADKITVVTYL